MKADPSRGVVGPRQAMTANAAPESRSDQRPSSKPSDRQGKRDQSDRNAATRMLEETQCHARVLGTLHDNDVGQTTDDEQVAGQSRQRSHGEEPLGRQILQ